MKPADVSSLKGAALAWAVARAEGRENMIYHYAGRCYWRGSVVPFDPGSCSAWASRMILGKQVRVLRVRAEPPLFRARRLGYRAEAECIMLAVARCFVFSELGAKIPLPAELNPSA